MKSFFEKMLWSSRYLTLLAVWSCIVGMALMFFLSALDIAQVMIDFVDIYLFGHSNPNFHTELVTHVISAVDGFLLAMVLLIFGLGVYELHIDKIDVARENPATGKLLQIESLDDLKNRLGKVILMILVVSFFKNVLNVQFTTPMEILYMAGGILFVSLATYFGHKSEKHL